MGGEGRGSGGRGLGGGGGQQHAPGRARAPASGRALGAAPLGARDRRASSALWVGEWARWWPRSPLFRRGS
jgi:hypothetical protein